MRREESRKDRNATVSDLFKGALAGAVGVWALDRAVWFMWDREDPEALEQEREARPGGLDPAHVIANRAAHAVGQELSPKQPHPTGIAAHYGLGIVPGALYGMLRDERDGMNIGRGLLYGMGLFLLQDEVANRILGTAGPMTDYPWQAHVRGVVGHLVLGAVTEITCEALDQIA